MNDTAKHAPIDTASADTGAAPCPSKRHPWLPGIICAALMACMAALPCLAEEPAEDAVGEVAPAGAAPAAAEQTDPAKADLPRHEDGTINYYQVLVDRYSAGVTPENNGAVLLVRAVGPKVFNEDVREEALAQLALSDLPEDAQYFEPLRRYVSRTVQLEQQEDYDDRAILVEITSRPWSAAEYPIAAGWLDANEVPLALIVEATQRSHCYMPKISPSDPPTLIAAFPGELAWMRRAALALSARAMLKLDSGDVDGAWRDVLAVRRLARQIGNGPFLIEMLVGLGIDGIAIDAGKAILASGSPTPDQLQTMLTDTLPLPPVHSLADTLATERLFVLDTLEALKREPSTDPSAGSLNEVLSGIGNGKNVISGLGDVDIDWQAVREATEHWHDRCISAATAPDYAEHLRLTKELETDFDEFVEDFPLDVPDPEDKRALLSMFMPELSALRAVSERYQAKSSLYALALAAKLYLARNDQYPAAIEDLTPDYLPEVPIDGFTGEVMRYVRAADGCKVYSLGPNMIDDGGFNYDDFRRDADVVMPEGMTEDADDIVIELGRAEE